MEESREVEAKNHGGLDDWFKKEKWVDVSRPKKKGKGYEPCGRGDTSKGKKPVCTPANKAKNLTEKERKNRIRQKRKKEKEPNPDKKPNVTNYSPGAGGKSNVSRSYTIKVVTGSKKPHWDDYLSDNDLIGITYEDMVGYPDTLLSKDQILENAAKLELIKKDPKFDPSIQGSNPSMDRFQRPINGFDELKLDKVKKYSYQAEIAADSIYRSGLDYAKELSMSNDIGALNDKNFSEIPNEKRSKLKYFHSVIVNQLIEQAEKTKNIKQLRMLIFIQENNVNIFNFSELLDIAQEYMDDSK
jgi:hypothetical protein